MNDFQYGKQRFSDEGNLIYKHESIEKLLEDKDEIVNLIHHHQNHQRPRLKTLREYYKGNNQAILEKADGLRRREKELADNRPTHNFAKYVSQFIQGYMLGIPLKTSYPTELGATIDDDLKNINRTNDADEHNSELVLDQSIYGRAYEMVYRNQQDETRFIQLDVMETFLIYDDSIEVNPIAGVRYVGKQFEDEVKVYIYTETDEHVFSLDANRNLEGVEINPHYFYGVPIIEYQNNKYRQGDFEDVIPLIDLYDNAQADTSNYMQDLNDAMLLIKGNLELNVEEAKEMKRNNIIFLQTEKGVDGREGSADASYIYKQYDVAGTEAYKDRIFQNILLFTSIPNLLDEKSGGPQSGEALKMKLFALSQKRATKERLFKKSLRDRYRLINSIGQVAKETDFDVNEIEITFTENLPSMIAKDIEWFSKMGGKLSNKTMLDNLPFVENAEDEMEKIEEENELNQDIYGFATGDKMVFDGKKNDDDDDDDKDEENVEPESGD